jgi:protein-S-isoprenylcysteine O-methyltransferase Ste14
MLIGGIIMDYVLQYVNLFDHKGDISKFSSLLEYKIYLYFIGFLFLSEFIIWLVTSSGFMRKRKEKSSDSGTMWLIILGYSSSIFVSYYFRSQNFAEPLRNLLLPHIFYYMGIFLIIFGVFIRDFSVWTLKRAFTLRVQTTDNQHLIQKGFYKYVRNPAYLGSILSLLGIAFSLRSVFAPFVVLIICLICYGVRIKIEEKALRSQFKEVFDEYCKHTYRLFPFIW